MFVIMPFEEYERLIKLTTPKVLGSGNIPLEVAEIALLEDKSLIRAWREHLGLTQEEVAARIGISRGAFAQMEMPGVRTRKATLLKVAEALGISLAQLEE